MLKSSIGELKLSPLKEDGMFVFFNDFITINGKVAKGDDIKIFVRQYENKLDKVHLQPNDTAKTIMKVRGKEKTHEGLAGYDTLEKLYDKVAAIYKEHYYFGDSN